MMPKPKPKTTRRKTKRRATKLVTLHYSNMALQVERLENVSEIRIYQDGVEGAKYIVYPNEAARVARVLSPEPRRRKVGGR